MRRINPTLRRISTRRIVQRIRRENLVDQFFFDFHAEANFGASFATDKLHHDSKRKHAAIN